VRPFGLSRQRLRDVNSRDVSEWFTELEQEGVKPPSIRKAKAALSAMLATAAQAGDIHGNPAMGVRFVSSNAQPNRKRRALTVEDVDAILSKLEPEWRLFFELLAQSGCVWANYSASPGHGCTWVTIPTCTSRSRSTRASGSDSKTEGSERAIPLSPRMARALTDWKDATDYGDHDALCSPRRSVRRWATRTSTTASYSLRSRRRDSTARDRIPCVQEGLRLGPPAARRQGPPAGPAVARSLAAHHDHERLRSRPGRRARRR